MSGIGVVALKCKDSPTGGLDFLIITFSLVYLLFRSGARQVWGWVPARPELQWGNHPAKLLVHSPRPHDHQKGNTLLNLYIQMFIYLFLTVCLGQILPQTIDTSVGDHPATFHQRSSFLKILPPMQWISHEKVSATFAVGKWLLVWQLKWHKVYSFV